MKKEFFYPMRNPHDPYHVEKVPISEKVYKTIYPEIWKTLQQMQRSGQCTCPKAMLWKCDADCTICTYRSYGNTVSFDMRLNDTDGLTLADTLASDKPSPEAIAMDKALLEALYDELDRLDHDGRRICELVAANCTEREAASILGVSKTAFRYQWTKIKKQLTEKLKEYI